MTLVGHLRSLGLSAREAREAMQWGKVRLGGVPTADPGREVDPAAVTIDPRAPRLAVGRDPVLLHRDDHLAVVWKPPGLLSVPAPGRHGEPSILGFVGRVCHLRGPALAVHRLDEDTSGLMLVALTAAAQTRLKARFETHDVERIYLALVQGEAPARLTIDRPIVRDRGDGLRGVGPGGRPAVTHVERLESLRAGSLVQARLETGRTHQVRIHLAAIGHPLLGDRLYAPAGVARRSHRLALHSAVLGFDHPLSGRPMRFAAPLADDLEALRRSLTQPAARPSPPRRH